LPRVPCGKIFSKNSFHISIFKAQR
jgi:hypothetical protein